MIRHTSKQALASLKDLGHRQYQVLEAIHKNKAVANLDIAEYLRMPINQITPRTNELVQAGLVHEEYTNTHPKTNKTVIYWGLTQRGERMFKHSIPWGQLLLI